MIVAPACELLDGSHLRDATRRAFAGFPDYFDATLLIQVPKQSATVTEHRGFRLVAFPKYRSSREYMFQRPSTLRDAG